MPLSAANGYTSQLSPTRTCGNKPSNPLFTKLTFCSAFGMKNDEPKRYHSFPRHTFTSLCECTPSSLVARALYS